MRFKDTPFYQKSKKFVLLKILKRKYLRTGQCNGCGRCCREIYVKHAKGIIKTEEEFKKLKIHPFYTYLIVREVTDEGLVFECKNLNHETGRCSIYKDRALICKLYPQEEIFMLGGVIAEDCGYKFVPLESFEEVFSQIKKKRGKSTFDCTCLDK